MRNHYRSRAAAARAVCVLLAGLAGIATLPDAHAHAAAPEHGCTAPNRPANDQNDALWRQFLDDVDSFRACISTFAEANHQAARLHNEAANAATLDWNRFVRAELNVPEDYPWPPEAADGGR